MLSLIIVVAVFGVLVLIHEAGHFIAAKMSGIAVEVFSVGMGRKLFGVKLGGTDFRLSLIPFGGYCKMAGEEPEEAKGGENEFLSKSVGSRFWVIGAGSITNYIFAFLLFVSIYMVGVPTLSSTVGQVLSGYPAEKSGIRAGDKVLSINGIGTRYWDDILNAIQEEGYQDEPLEIKLSRDGEIITYNVSPDIRKTKNIFGQETIKPMLGIGPASEISDVKYGFIQAFVNGGKRLFELTEMTYKMLWLILTGGMPVKDSVSGPIGIAFFIKQAASAGIVPLLLITAHVSLALAIFNLLPFPVLDGGHIIFLLIEKIKGTPVSIKTQEISTNIALVLIVSFAVFVSVNDIKRFTPFGKKKAPEEVEITAEE